MDKLGDILEGKHLSLVSAVLFRTLRDVVMFSHDKQYTETVLF